MSEFPSKTEKSIRVFISYSSEDGIIAGQIKSYLQTYFGLEVFLAHEDIEGGEKFEDAIIENLKSIDFFIPLLSPNFMGSKFTDQEVGIAYVLGKRIIPISLVPGATPYGFINKFQAIKLKMEYGSYHEWMQFTEKIIAVISKDLHHGQKIKSLIIKAFGKSDSFEVSNNFINIFKKYEPYNSEQVSMMISTLCKNSTNRNELYHLPGFFSEFTKKYKQDINSVDEDELKSYFRMHTD